MPATPDEAAFAAELSRRNDFTESFAKAKELEHTINEFARTHFDTDEIQDFNSNLIADRLDPQYGHVREQVTITGWVHMMTFDHQHVNLVPASELEASNKLTSDIPTEASNKEKVWREKKKENEKDHEVVHSLGFFALKRGYIEGLEDDPSIEDNPYAIYLVAKAPLTRVAYHDIYGEMHTSHRYIIPIDGSVDVQLAQQQTAPNPDLLDIYLGKEILDTIGSTITNAETLTDALQALGQIDLSSFNYVFDNEKTDGDDVMAALTFLIRDEIKESLGVDYRRLGLYQFGGVENIKYFDKIENTFIPTKIDRNMIYTGDIHSVGIDPKKGRFVLMTAMDFDDGTRRHVIYPMDEKLVVVPCEKIPILGTE